MELAIELSRIATLRRVLEIFCARHELEFADRPAIIAARELMKFADEGETDPVILQRRLDEAIARLPFRGQWWRSALHPFGSNKRESRHCPLIFGIRKPL